MYFAISFTALAEKIEGSMNCKILDTSVLSMQEGKVTRYSGSEGRVNKGDKFGLVYVFQNKKDKDTDFSLAIKLNSLNEDVVFFKYGDSIISNKLIKFYESNLAELGYNRAKGQKVDFGGNRIVIKTRFNGELRLQRYYKGDWNGFFNSYSDPYNSFSDSHTVETHAVECKSSIDKVDQILGIFKEKAKSSN